MTLKDQLLAVSTAFSAHTGKTEARISTEIWNHGGRLKRLRDDPGADMRSGNIERGLLWFSARWPEGAAWPSDVPRPAAPPPAPVSSSSVPSGPPA